MGGIEQTTPEDVTSMILSFSDPNLITLLFEQLDWNYSQEIIETLKIARQNVNLASKLSAIKYLRQIIKESAEASGMIGSVSKTYQGADGSQTTFSAKNIVTALESQRKQINSEEIVNDKTELEEVKDADVDRESTGSPSSGGDTPQVGSRGDGGNNIRPGEGAVGTGDSKSEPPAEVTPPANQQITVFNGGGSPGSVPIGEIFGDDPDAAGGSDYEQPPKEGSTEHPCIEHRPPSRDRKLYPGVSGTPDGGKTK